MTEVDLVVVQISALITPKMNKTELDQRNKLKMTFKRIFSASGCERNKFVVVIAWLLYITSFICHGIALGSINLDYMF